MRAAVRRCLSVIILCAAFPAFASETAQVARVVDGDTLEVAIGGRIEKVRLIGVDTPETVHPQKPVEFFGKEASEFTRRTADRRRRRLGEDASRAGTGGASVGETLSLNTTHLVQRVRCEDRT